jgi:hypothetical protein
MKDFDIFEIDPHQLDTEWLNQPRLFVEWADKLSDAKEAYERAKASRDLVEAQLALRVRQNPKKYGFDKATDKLTEQIVAAHPKLQRYINQVIICLADVDHLKAVVDALHQRKAALENSVQLFAMKYTAMPRLPDDEESRSRLRDVKRRSLIKGIKPKRK